MEQIDRRTFLQTAGAAMVAGSGSRILGANDKINLVVIGLGGRGNSHMRDYANLESCRVTGVCDVNQAARERGVALIEKLTQSRPKEYSDMREVFDDKSVDAVSMATPNHWHALGTIWACQAGKDVYVEKPACHDIWEGWKMVEAARKYERMVQVGSQGRTIAHKVKAMQMLKDGVIGKVYLAKGLCFKRRPSIGHKPDEPTPAGLDWDRFLGPAPMRPYNELRFRYNWHWFWDTGNGDIGNQGIHEMDIARWGLGKEGWPMSAVSTGGKYVYEDDQETPNTQIAVFSYGDAEIMFEVRGVLTGGEGTLEPRGGNTIGNIFLGSEGWMAVDGYGFQVYKGEYERGVKKEPAISEKSTGEPTSGHMDNFLQAVKSRKRENLHAEVAIGVESATLVHLANVSYRIGRKLDLDPVAKKIKGDSEAAKMMTRSYRKPYVVPDKV